MFNERFKLFVIKKIGLPHTNVRIGYWTMNRKRRYFYPIAIFIIFTRLGDFTDIDLWVKVRGKCLSMISSVAIYNIKIMYFVKIVFKRISCKNSRDSRIKTTS